MPNYNLLSMKGHQFGLNRRVREDELAPGEAAVSKNVEYRNYTISKRKGYSRVLTGSKDAVLRGGPPGSSLYVQGDTPWLNHPNYENSGVNQHRDFPPNQRLGLMMVEEHTYDIRRLNVTSGDDDWAIECMIWSDDFHSQPHNPKTDSFYRHTVVMAKGDDTKTQWAVRIVPDDEASGGTDIRSRFRIVLTLYENADPSVNSVGNPNPINGEDYGYGIVTPGDVGAWFTPGLRHWVGWRFQDDIGGGVPAITSYYWQEGMGAPVSENSSLGTIRTNGVGSDDNLPIVIGRRSNIVRNSTDRYAERGFNGVVSELRLWAETESGVFPTWDSDWYLEEEIPDDTLSSVVSTNNLHLYHSFSNQYRDTLSETGLMTDTLPARHTPNGSGEKAWLTGYDGSWATEGGEAGLYLHRPSANSPLEFQGAMGQEDANYERPEINGPGIRVPNGDKYMLKEESTTNSGYAFPTEFSVRMRVSMGTAAAGQSLFEVRRVRQGGTVKEYTVNSIFSLSYNGTDIMFNSRNDTTNESLTSTQAMGSNQTIVATVSFREQSQSHIMKLYLDGVHIASQQVNLVTKPDMSQVTGSDSTVPNTNTNDGRDACFPMVIGCRSRRAGTTYPPAVPGQDDNEFWFGSVGNIGTSAASDRLYWGFYSDDTRATPNAGVLFRGFSPLRGVVHSCQVWAKELTESEVLAYNTRSPDEQEIASYGKDLLSSWDFDSLRGNIVRDRGFLGNHLRVHPYPQVRSVAQGCGRRQKSEISGFWEVRTRTPREGTTGREIYGLGGGSVLRMVKDSSGDPYFKPISNRLIAIEEPQPYGFQYSDYFYICNGEGPLLRVSRGKVTYAGLSPVFSEQIQHDNLGWLEHDRDGTFRITQTDAALAADVVFEEGNVYRYAITYFDPEAAVESAPSRQMVFTAETSAGGGAESFLLDHFPRAQERNVTAYRIYRTVANGGEFRFLAEVSVANSSFRDDIPDTSLGNTIQTAADFPPPQGVRFAATIGGNRVLYAGVKAQPGTLFPSKAGLPEAAPPQYQLTIAEGRSSEITGLHTIQDRTLVFLQDTTFAATDLGGDLGPQSLTRAPVAIQPLRKDIGCVEHHTIVDVDGLGVVFAGERGLYVTDGGNFQYVSERIEPLWEELDKSTYRQWHAVHWRRSDYYVLFCRKGTGGGRNNVALIWDYKRNAFTLWENIEARFSQIIEDETTGQNRLYFSDYLGQLFELDAPDSPVDNDGGVAASSGTVKAGSTTTRINLVSDNSLPTTADGLRGVPLTIGGEVTRVLYNDDTFVDVETALSSTPSTGATWYLGAIETEWKSGQLDFGTDTTWKKHNFVQPNNEPNSGSLYDVEVQLGDQPANTFTDRDAGAKYARCAPILGRETGLQVTIKDEKPDNPWEVRDIEGAWIPRGRARW